MLCALDMAQTPIRQASSIPTAPWAWTARRGCVLCSAVRNDMYIHMTTLDEVSNECAALRARMAARNVTRIFDEALRPLDLKVTQFTLLVAVRQGRPESIAQLADALAMERTTLTRNLRLLEKRGLLEVGPEGYRRARHLKLTEAGAVKLAEALPIWRATQDRIVGRLGAGSWGRARRGLEQLARA